MPTTLKEQLRFLKEQALVELHSEAAKSIHQRDQAIIKAATDEVLSPLEIQRALRLSRSRYYQITRPDTRV